MKRMYISTEPIIHEPRVHERFRESECRYPDAEAINPILAIEDIVDFEVQAKANNKAMKKVLGFIAPE